MKKKLFTLTAALFAAFAASAQLSNGSVAPDWTFTDLNGVSHTLYTDLAAGKTVYIDVSAAWCAPCWAYHNSRALDSLWMLHGPTGGTGVSGTTTNDVVVYFIEGESTNTTSQLYGPAASTGSYATTTQGDWVTGTDFPIIDPASAAITTFNSNYNIGYFPTVYMICQDHLISEVGQVDQTALYAARTAGCPSYGPSATTNAKAVAYSGSVYFMCNAAPTIKFQNYSATSTLTAATINIYSGASIVATQPWTGSLAPYAVASVAIPAFTPSGSGPYSFEVVVTGDSYAADNTSASGIFSVYGAANAGAIPFTQIFDGLTVYPPTMSYGAGTGIYEGATLVQADGSTAATNAASYFDFFDLTSGTTADLIIGNFNTTGATALGLSFDVAYAQYTAATPENDALALQASTDCGVTWTTVWTKSGDALKTTAPYSSGQFIPSAASMWRYETVNLSSYANSDLFLRFHGTSNYGNLAWVDNLNMTGTLGVVSVMGDNSVSLYPNPANEQTNVRLNLAATADVQVTVMDAMGRMVYTSSNANTPAGASTIVIPTSNLASGVYNVKVQAGANSVTKQLSIVK